MSLCNSIDTLAMAYVDDELATEERHELEAHLTECTSCRSSLDRERADRSMVRRALAGPAAPDLLRARIGHALDEQDRDTNKQQRRRWSSYLLPSSAILAAAAAIAVFVGVQAPSTDDHVPNVAEDAARQGARSLPLEVQGASTGPWLQRHFASDVQPPQFVESGTQLLGARLLPNGINGHDAALMSYQVLLAGRPPFVLSVVAVHDLDGDELRAGTPVRVNGRTMFVFDSHDEHGRRQTVVSYVAPNNVGFMFVAPELAVNELIGLVSRTNLVAP